MHDLVSQYDKRCNYQPLPLFHSTLAQDYDLHDEELINAVLAVSLNFSNETVSANTVEPLARYAARADALVNRKLTNGGVGLGTIQALCLLSFWEFSSKTLVFQRYWEY